MAHRHLMRVLFFVAVVTNHVLAAGFDWQTTAPDLEGIPSSEINVIKERMIAKKTTAFLVIRNDHIVCEWYAAGHSTTTKEGTASLAKALVGGMGLAVAMQDGVIALDDHAAKFIPQLKDDARKSKILI